MGRGLSDLQKHILAGAYDGYRVSRREKHHAMRPHITAGEVVYSWLGGDKLPMYRGRIFGYDYTFNPTGVRYEYKWQTDEQRRQYQTAYAVACKALKRLEQRGLITRYETPQYKPGYILTEQGLVIAAPLYEAEYAE